MYSGKTPLTSTTIVTSIIIFRKLHNLRTFRNAIELDFMAHSYPNLTRTPRVVTLPANHVTRTPHRSGPPGYPGSAGPSAPSSSCRRWDSPDWYREPPRVDCPDTADTASITWWGVGVWDFGSGFRDRDLSNRIGGGLEFWSSNGCHFFLLVELFFEWVECRDFLLVDVWRLRFTIVTHSRTYGNS